MSRPVFTLIEVTNPIACFNFGVTPGTIIGCLSFPSNSQPSGKVKGGRILFDSRKNPNYKVGDAFEITFVAPHDQYIMLYRTCNKSDKGIVRHYTSDLIKRISK